MNTFARHWTLGAILVSVLLGTISCSSDNPVDTEPPTDPPAHDTRSPFIHIVVESSNTAEGYSVDKVGVYPTYGAPWNPNGGPVPMVIVGIDGCDFRLNGKGPLSLVEDNNFSKSTYLMEPLTGFGYQPPDPIHFCASLPSEEENYPGGYPAFSIELPTEAVEVEVPNLTPLDPSGSVVWPPTYHTSPDGEWMIRFTLHRDPEMDPSIATVVVDEEYIWTDGSFEDEIWSQVRFTQPDAEGNVDIVIRHELRSEANVIRVTLRYSAYSIAETVDIVEGKTALIWVEEEATLTRDCAIDTSAPVIW
ncbi:hypothetical protein KQI63_08610 [bacterium]|nr:hypothetical protein [bacterium]